MDVDSTYYSTDHATQQQAPDVSGYAPLVDPAMSMRSDDGCDWQSALYRQTGMHADQCSQLNGDDDEHIPVICASQDSVPSEQLVS